MFAHTPPFTFGEHVWAVLIHVGYGGAIGAIFSYLILLVTSSNILFRGWLWGNITWFVVYIATSLFKVEGTMPIPLNTAISNFIASSIYGLVMGHSLTVLEPRGFTSNNRLMPKPAAKRLPNQDEGDEGL